MKHFLKNVALTMISLSVVSLIAPGLSFQQSLGVLLVTSLFLAVANTVIKPILKIIFLPITILTFGIFNWFLNALILYLTTLVVPGFSITGFTMQLAIFSLVFSTFWAYIALSFILSFVSTLSAWVFGE